MQGKWESAAEAARYAANHALLVEMYAEGK